MTTNRYMTITNVIVKYVYIRKTYRNSLSGKRSSTPTMVKPGNSVVSLTHINITFS